MKDESTRIFVDAIEDDDVYLVVGEKRFVVPRAMLPKGAAEGSWLRLAVEGDASLGREIEARRGRLLGTDPGGDIKL
jgi:hypothetical protein